MTTVTRQIHFAFKGRRKRAVAGPPPDPANGGGNAGRAAHGGPDAATGRVPRVARLMALAIRFDKLIRDGVVASQSELAVVAQVTQPRMTQIMNLLHLAPDIQEQILFLPPTTDGRDPIHEHMLRATSALSDWRVQRRMWTAMRGTARLIDD